MKITINRTYAYSPSGSLYDKKMRIKQELYKEFLEYIKEDKETLKWIIWHNEYEYDYRGLKRNENIIFLSNTPNTSFYRFLKSKDIKFSERLYTFNLYLELV